MSKADGSLTFSMNVDNSNAAKKLNEVEQKIKNLGIEYNKLSTERDTATQSARQQEIVLDREMALLQEMRNAPKGTYEKAEIAEQAERVRGLRAEYNATERSVERMTAKMGKTSEKIDEAKTRAGELTERITTSVSAVERMKNATAEANKKMDKFVTRVKNLAKRVFVFSLITSALRSMRTWFGNVIKSNKEATAAIAKFKGALLTLIQPLVNVIIPALTNFINILTYGITALARIMSALFGTTAEESANAAEGLYKEQQALNSVGSAAKSAAKKLANFDEINQLGEDSSASNSTIIPDFNLPKLPDWLDAWVTGIEVKIKEFRFWLTEGGESDGKENWKKFLAPALGAIIGLMFGGLSGAVIGLGLGLLANLISAKFKDETDERDTKRSFKLSLLSILGAAIGTIFGGLPGGLIGLVLGTVIGVDDADFDDETDEEKSGKSFRTALFAILGGALGKMFGGITGAIIGLGLGLLISLLTAEYDLTDFKKEDAKALAKTALLAVLGFVFGNAFFGLPGGLIGLALGLSIGLISASFDDDLSASAKKIAQDAALLVLTSILTAIFGAIFLGFSGGLLAGVIVLSLGVLFKLSFDGLQEKVPNFTGIGPDYSWMFEDKEAKVTLPSLANGSTVPSNRNFNASWVSPTAHELEDAGILSPASSGLSTVKSSRSTTVVLELDRRELGRAVVETGGRESTRIGTKLVY